MLSNIITQLLATKEGRVFFGGVGCILLSTALFWWGRLSAPAPDEAVICAPMLTEVKKLKDESVHCSQRVLAAAQECIAREKKACAEKADTRTNLTGKRACEVCEAAKKAGTTP